MALRVRDAELFGVSENSCTISFVVDDGSGPVDARARVQVGDATVESAGTAGTRLVRIEGLAPDETHDIVIELEGGTRADLGSGFPAAVRTFPAPQAAQVASFASMNDLHFGEEYFGGTLTDDFEYGPEAPNFPAVRGSDTDEPYWKFMNDDAIADINALGVDAAIIKGDIADRGLPEQFEAARQAFARFTVPHHVLLGNHDHYPAAEGRVVDGFGILDVEPTPRVLDLGGWKLVLLDSVHHGHTIGVFPEDRRSWLSDRLDETRDADSPTLVVMHHQAVPPGMDQSYPASIGMKPEDSVPFIELIGRHPQVRAVLIGHTHQNRARRHHGAPHAPFLEVHSVPHYPGGFGHLRLFEDGHLRQEVRRTSSPRALEHSTKCRSCFAGGYREFALGRLEDRSLIVGA